MRIKESCKMMKNTKTEKDVEMKLAGGNKAISEIKKQCAKYGISLVELSIYLRVTSVRVYEIMKGKRGITIDTDLRLCKFFNLPKKHFINLQIDYDMAVQEVKLGDKLAKIENVRSLIKRS